MSKKIKRKDDDDEQEEEEVQLTKLPTENELSPKQEAFCWNYVTNGNNATKAARDAGYAYPDKNYIKILKSSKVRDRIEELLEPFLKAQGLSREKILQDLQEQADVDMADIVDVKQDGSAKLNPGFGGKGKYIRKFTYKKDGVISVEKSDPIKAKELIARMQGLEEPKELNVKIGPSAEALEQAELAKQRANAGIIDCTVIDVKPIEEEIVEDEEEEE